MRAYYSQMLRYVSRLWAAWWGVALATQEVAPVLAPTSKVVAPVSPAAVPSEPDLTVEFQVQFKRDILDRLPRLFRSLSRLRRHLPDAYAASTKLGVVVTRAFHAGLTRRDLLTIDARPAMGAVAFQVDALTGKDTECVMPSLVYFIKVRQPAKVEPFVGDIYCVNMFYDLDFGRTTHDGGMPHEYYVGVFQDGTTQVLRQRVPTRDVFRVVRGRRRETIEWRGSKWMRPQYLNDNGIDPHLPVFHFALETWARLANESRLLVRCTRGRTTGVFPVPVKATASFFKDREVTALAEDGKRKRIFHVVSTHGRRRANGRTSEVRRHFRGLRRFDWNGYRVCISRQTDAASVTQRFNVAATQVDDQDLSGVDWLTEGQAAGVLATVAAGPA